MIPLREIPPLSLREQVTSRDRQGESDFVYLFSGIQKGCMGAVLGHSLIFPDCVLYLQNVKAGGGDCRSESFSLDPSRGKL